MSLRTFEIKYKDKKYQLSDFTDDVKSAYCRYIAQVWMKNAQQFMTVSQYEKFVRSLVNTPPEWTTQCDPDVATSLSTDARKEQNHTQLLRLLLNIDEDVMDDVEFSAMIISKKKDPGSDFSLAWDIINTGSGDPKVQRVSPGSGEAQTENQAVPGQ